MYKVIKVNPECACLLDLLTLQPPLLVLRFSIDELRFKSYNFQHSSLSHIKSFYKFWLIKYKVTLDYTFYEGKFSETAISLAVESLNAFWVYLNRNKNHANNSVQINQFIENKNIKNIQTNVAIYKTICRFIRFLINTYITTYYQDKDIQEIYILQKGLQARLDFESKNHTTKFNRTGTVPLNYKSLTSEQVKDLLLLVKPSSNSHINHFNPFESINLQYRNYIIIKILLSYGLRIAEALLLRITSFKTNLAQTKFYMRIDTLDDDLDSRKSRLSIKNSFSIRELEISKNDFILINNYYDNVRCKCKHPFLFTSNVKPNEPLSYKSVYATIATTINSNFMYYFPEHYDAAHNIDAIKVLNPHSLRHTWAYHTLSSLFEQQNLHYKKANTLDVKGIMEIAKDQLRTLGGWAPNSVMPSHYAKRFISENANLHLMKHWLTNLTSDPIEKL
jgi:integrase